MKDNTGVIYVNNNYTGVIENGTIGNPFKSIQDAIDSIGTNDTWKLVKVMPSASNYSTFTVRFSRVKVEGVPSKNEMVRVNGNIIIENSKIEINGFTATNNIIINNFVPSSNISNVLIDNCKCVTAQVGLMAANSFDTDITFRNCEMSRWTTAFSTAKVLNIENCKCIDQTHNYHNIQVYNDCEVNILNCSDFSLEKRSGIVNIYNSKLGELNVNRVSIEDSSNNNSDKLMLYSGSAENINKTGNSDYYLGSFLFNRIDSVLTGTKISDYGLSSLQLFDHTSRSNYNIADFSLKAHLDGINTALGNSGGPTAWIRKSVKNIGETETYPGFVDIRINSGNLECRGNAALQSQDGLFVGIIDISDTVFQEKITPLASVYAGGNTIQVPIGFGITKAYKNGPVLILDPDYKHGPFLMLDPADEPTKLSVYGQVANVTGMLTIGLNLNATIIL